MSSLRLSLRECSDSESNSFISSSSSAELDMAAIIARFWSHFAFQMLLQMFKQASRLGYQGYRGKIGLSGLSGKDRAIRAIRARLGYQGYQGKIGLS